ncbi:MAG: TIORF34 protein [uncultured Sulfurovum sp.]|uniref:TIORF34 protein n=1 Tax=uncultured Sulfurovum sp. TaxID=269237 RepID=A0A6S6T9F4_9BACT|nr:MAG: TIORF34 protein [uncultured Sulfurovum sp.]
MNEILINTFISPSRFSKYKTLANYEENLISSKQYYIPLSILEVSLRNAINNHFEKMYGRGWLLHQASFLRNDLVRKIDEAKLKLNARNENINKEKLVAELSFGFWTSLFKVPYAKQMRTYDLKRIFPNLPPKHKELIDRAKLSTRLNHIRAFRNRISHHEKITDKSEFKNIGIEINSILFYFDEDILAFSKRLNHVH